MVKFEWNKYGGKISINQYYAGIRNKDKSAFDDLYNPIFGTTRILTKIFNYISLYYSADVGRCIEIRLYKKGDYNQKWYFDQIKYSHTHDLM